jgi:hypothetical protein
MILVKSLPCATPYSKERIRMATTTRALSVATLIALSAAAGTAAQAADDLLGLYVGAALGSATVRDNETVPYTPLQFSQSGMGWKVLGGIRPIPLVGAEFEYIDFGHPARSSFVFPADVQARAPAVFGLLYAPLPSPLWDVYAKAGIARLKTTANASFSGPICTVCEAPPSSFSFHGEQTNEHVAYGLGTQLKISSFAVRAEYERINDSNGDPDLLSVGLTYSF